MTNSVVSSANIEAHSRIILQKFIQRELIRISGEIISDSYEDTTDVFDLLDEAEQAEEAFRESVAIRQELGQPGMQMVTTGSVKAGHHGKEIESDLTHICVCGTYPRIKKAVSGL